MLETATSIWQDIDWSEHVQTLPIARRMLNFVDYGQGRPLVLLHGMGGCWQWWLEVLPELGRHHRVIAVDLPGFGESGSPTQPYDMDLIADIVAELLEQLGISKTAVAGHSMGGLVTISLASRRPDLVERAVLVDAGGVPMSERRLAAILKLLRGSFYLFTRPRILNRLATDEKARVRLLRMAMRDPRTLSPDLARIIMPKIAAPSFLDSIPASARAIDKVRPEALTMPTLLLWGARDAFAPLHTAHALLSRLPNGELAVISNAGHSPMIEAPATFLSLLLPFTTRNHHE